MNSAEARVKVQGNPLSFIHVDKAEVDLPEGVDLYSDAVYAKAAENLQKLSDEGVCFTEDAPKLYIYRQQWNGVCQTGIVGCASVDDYLNGVIKRHELTRIPDMVAEVEAVKTDNDVVKRWFIDSMLDASDLDGRWVKDVYADFRRWCDDAGEKFGVAQVVFTKRVLATLATLETVNTRDRAVGKRGRRFVNTV
jgi:hypothetical protein